MNRQAIDLVKSFITHPTDSYTTDDVIKAVVAAHNVSVDEANECIKQAQLELAPAPTYTNGHAKNGHSTATEVAASETIIDKVVNRQIEPTLENVYGKTHPYTPPVLSEDQALDKKISDEIDKYLASGLDDAEIKAALAKDYEGEFDDLIKQAHLRMAEELEKSHTEEDYSANVAREAKRKEEVVSLENKKLWLENWGYRNKKNTKLITDPQEIERYYTTFKEVEDAERKAEESISLLADAALPTFPRFSGVLHDLAEALYPDLPYEFKMMAAVTHWGLSRSGVDHLENELHLQPRFYTCFVKDPGYGKTACINEIREWMKSTRPSGFSMPSSVDSGPALVDEFSDCQKAPLALDRAARVLLDPDEMKDLFEKAKVTSQSKNSLVNELLKLYEGNRTGNRSRKAGKAQLDDAHLAILGGATPDGYSVMWTGTGGASSGLQSRFVVVTTENPKMPTNKKPTDAGKLSAALAQLKQLSQLPGQTIRLSPEASSMLTDWWDGIPRDKPSEVRVDDYVKRLLIVLAVTNNQTVVGPELMLKAIQFGDYVIAVREKFNPQDSYSWTQAFENDIVAVAKRHKRPMTQMDFHRAVNPARKPGGLGPFKQAWQNVVSLGVLVQNGTTTRGKAKYRLP